VLIDQTSRARLADFGLLTIISDPANLLSSSSCTQGGTARWMSPELIAPQRFGLKDSRPTKSSDCYALGMVIYETVSGNLPFHEDSDLTVFVKVLEGGHPRRGARFTRDLWKVLEQCWASPSNNRPSAEDILQSLERLPNSLGPLSPRVDERVEDGVSECTVDFGFSIPSSQGSNPPITLPDQENESRSQPSPLSVSSGVVRDVYRTSSYSTPPGGIGEFSQQLNSGGNLLSEGPSLSGKSVHGINPINIAPMVSKPDVTTTVTALDSERRRKTDANFACPVPGCGSTFTRHFNLKGAFYGCPCEMVLT